MSPAGLVCSILLLFFQFVLFLFSRHALVIGLQG